MGQTMPKPGLRPFLPADAAVCAAIYEASITELTSEDYTEAQQEAWIAALDEDDLANRLGRQLTLIATLRDAPVGFASLKDGHHIDFLFVHPAAVGQGVATALLDALEKLAAARGATKLTAEVSDTAHHFFRRRGYVGQSRNTVPRGDEWLGNTSMQKILSEPPKGAIQ
jgi:putative acetyltransferase